MMNMIVVPPTEEQLEDLGWKADRVTGIIFQRGQGEGKENDACEGK
jgi:hypothetical protein